MTKIALVTGANGGLGRNTAHGTAAFDAFWRMIA